MDVTQDPKTYGCAACFQVTEADSLNSGNLGVAACGTIDPNDYGELPAHFGTVEATGNFEFKSYRDNGWDGQYAFNDSDTLSGATGT